MKISGTQTFKASCQQVFEAILDPDVLKVSLPGCNQVAYLDPTHIQANLIPLIGPKQPYTVVIQIAKREEPSHLVLRIQHKDQGGSIHAEAQITLRDVADGTQLFYDINADLEGSLALANNFIGKGLLTSSLKSFFAGVEKSLSRVL